MGGCQEIFRRGLPLVAKSPQTGAILSHRVGSCQELFRRGFPYVARLQRFAGGAPDWC